MGATYGVVFSGGGALGAWEVGCYDAIRSRHGGNPPIVVTGASAGALNAVGVCAGMPPPQLERLWSEIVPADVFRFRFSKWDVLTILARARRLGLLGALLDFLSRYRSIHDTTPFKDTLRKILSGYFGSFAQSQIHFAISVTNLNNGRREYFYRLPIGLTLPANITNQHDSFWEPIGGLELLLDALLGSTALPVLFPPNGHYFDGGVLLNQPITPAILLNEPEILYVVIPVATSLGRTDNIIEIGQTVLTRWTAASLISQLDRIRLVNLLRKERADAGEQDKRIRVCVIRPTEDLTDKFGATLLSFGYKVRELVNDGKTAAYEKLNRFNPSEEATWYDV